MYAKSYKEGRLAFKSVDPVTEKVSTVNVSGLMENAEDAQIGAVRQALDPVLSRPSQTVEATYTYEYGVDF